MGMIGRTKFEQLIGYLFVNNEWKCYDLETKLEVEIKDRGLVNV